MNLAGAPFHRSMNEPNSMVEAGPPERRGWPVLVVLSAVAFMAQLDLFIVNVALPSMARSFPGAGLSDLSWVLNGYAIVFAALLVPAGRLADLFGRRLFLLIGVGVFSIASAVCAVAPDLTLLVAGRVAQAVGAVMIVPTSLGLLLAAFPARRHGVVVGVWAGVGAVAAASGAPVGGILVAIDWRWVFIVNLPIGLATIAAGIRILPEVRARRGERLPDPVSVASLLAAVTLFVLATVQGPVWGWGSRAVLGLVAASVIAVGLTVLRTLQHPRAVIERTLFRSREFTVASVALLLWYIGFAAWLLITVLFLEQVWHFSTVQAGLAIAPGPLVAALFAVNSGRIAAIVGRAVPAVAGTLLMAIGGTLWASLTTLHGSYVAEFLPALLLAGAGAGLAQAPLFAAASTLAPERATTGSAVLTMSRQVGSAVGVAILVVVLALPAPDRLDAFHHGWLLLVLTGISAAAVIVAGRIRRAPTVRPEAAPTGEIGAMGE